MTYSDQEKRVTWKEKINIFRIGSNLYIRVLSCDWKDCKQDKRIRTVATSSYNKHPSSDGWKEVTNLHYTYDEWIYFRKWNQKLMLHRYVYGTHYVKNTTVFGYCNKYPGCPGEGLRGWYFNLAISILFCNRSINSFVIGNLFPSSLQKIT